MFIIDYVSYFVGDITMHYRFTIIYHCNQSLYSRSSDHSDTLSYRQELYNFLQLPTSNTIIMR